MVQLYPRCRPDRLKLLLEEKLPVPQQTELVSHLDHCRQCQQTLERLAAEQPWWEELRRIADAEGGRALAAPADSGSTCTQAPESDDFPLASAAGLPADFLDAADDPAHLGRLGSFVITAVLGRGGMGIVLKGLDTALNRSVAIKLLAPHFASSGAARKRFAREAQAAAAVVHEHVVAIHGVDTWKGLPYLVMSFVDGRSLQERLDADGPLGVREILRIGMQTASGLAAAHAQGLVHRDIKPANILLENSVERVKITDFGLARAIDDASLTQSGVIAGTPQYMAPEQAQGETVDHRADLFSLGSVLYALCTGHPPFRADSAMAVLRRVCEERPRPIRSLNPDVPAWLAALIDKLHAKNPADRFQTATEVAELLGACLAHMQQPDVLPLPLAIAGSPWWQVRGWRRLGWTAIVLLALGLGVGVADRWRGHDRPNTGAKAQKETAEETLKDRREEASPLIQRVSEISVREEDPLKRPLEEIRRRMAELEADLKRPAGNGPAEPEGELLRQAWQRLEILKRELDSPAP